MPDRSSSTARTRGHTSAGVSADIASIVRVISAGRIIVQIGLHELVARTIESPPTRDLTTKPAVITGGGHVHTDSRGDYSGGGDHAHNDHAHLLGRPLMPGDEVLIVYVGGRTSEPVIVSRMVPAAP